jgi:hypothetical protein
LPARIGDPIRPAYDETEITAILLPVSKSPGKLGAGELFATFIEQYHLLGLREFSDYQLAFCKHCLASLVILASPYSSDRVEAKPPLPWKSVGVHPEGSVNPGRLAIADGQ